MKMARKESPGAAVAAAGLCLMGVCSTVNVGLAAAAVAKDHHSKIGIAHLVVVRSHLSSI